MRPPAHSVTTMVAVLAAAILFTPGAVVAPASAQTTADAPAGNPVATIDLATTAGVRLVGGQWRYSDARIVEVNHRGPGPDLRPSGVPIRTHDIAPKAGAADFDDSGWEAILPETLDARRASGRLSFAWYRIGVTIPERLGLFDPTGSTTVFEVVVDDYAEVWVNGSLPVVLGQTGGALVKGFNSPNRVVLGHDIRPGQKFQIAVFGANGPLSSPPGNFIWIRSATIDFHRPDDAGGVRGVPYEIVRRDPAIDRIVPVGTRLEKIAGGFQFTEGPVWHPDGYLLFSDPNANRIYRWSPDGQVSVFKTKSGYTGLDVGEYRQPGSNGLAFDPEGRLTINEHGNRRVTRLEKNGVLTVLAERHDGRRLNSPNDLVYRSNGDLYFTDPPFGLPKFHDDPRRETPYSGIYRLAAGEAAGPAGRKNGGTVQVLNRDLSGPNGLAFSPDERFLYVGNWDEKKKVVMRYGVRADGTIDAGRVFFDMTPFPGEDAIDGVKVDRDGNVYVSGPGGLFILSPSGKHLGTIVTPEHPHNFAWGDADGRTLYIAARSSLYRLRLGTPAGPVAARLPVAAGTIERRDPRFDALVPPGARLETIADGLAWVEGPVWDARDRSLLFTDIPNNAVMRWREGSGVSLHLAPSGYSGSLPFPGREPGANGLAIDGQGRLLLAEHGDRRITRLESGGRRTILADRYRGKRLNSPNDLAFGPDGAVYFTDPPFGLPRTFADPAKEIDWNGVYRIAADGAVTLVTRELRAPNGLAFSPDGRTLYVSNADRDDPVWMAFDLNPDGTSGRGRRFFEARPWTAIWPGDPDGMKVDRHGNLFAAGPGGVHLFAPDATHLGSILTGTATSNCNWGEDGSTLYITAGHAVHRIRLATSGAGFTTGVQAGRSSR